MSDIAPIGRPSAAGLPSSKQHQRVEQTTTTATRPSDKVELSTAAQLLSKIAELPDVRQNLVYSVRTQIELGSYETPEKIAIAIDALADDIT